MKKVILYVMMAAFLFSSAYADDPGISYYLPFENLDFISDDWVEQTGLKTIGERKWELALPRSGSF